MSKILSDANKMFDNDKNIEITYKWYKFLIDSNLDLTLIDYIIKLYYAIDRVPERYRNEIMKIRLRYIEKIIFNKN